MDANYLKEMLKIGTSIDHNFIDEFYDILFDSNTIFCINLDTILEWLELNRKEFVKSLKNKKRFKENTDYIVRTNVEGTHHRKKEIWFTKEAF